MYVIVREKTLKRSGGCHFKSFAPDKNLEDQMNIRSTKEEELTYINQVVL